MTAPAHHPSFATLACHAAGGLSPGAALVCALHLRRCARCRKAVRKAEEAAAATIWAAEPADLGNGAVAEALRRIETPRPEERPPPLPDLSPTGMRWCGPGMARRLIQRDGTDRLWLCRLAAGWAVPRHAHTGTELVLFLAGRHSDRRSEYAPGDLREYHDEQQDRLLCLGPEDGLALLAVEGPLRYRHWLPRLVLPSY